jgi:hypothetical protein
MTAVFLIDTWYTYSLASSLRSKQKTKDAYGVNFNRLKHIRQQLYDSFERGADALFNLGDALLCESQAQSLPELSLSPFFERQMRSYTDKNNIERTGVEIIAATVQLLEKKQETQAA